MTSERRAHYDLNCVNNPEKVCPVKRDIIGVATGDETGHTEIETELASRLVHAKFRERNTLAEGIDCSGDECPTVEMVGNMPVRRSVLALARSTYRLLSRQN